MNFTWWVNRKDRDGRNVFEDGFLGLDNIGVLDRSAPLPTGGFLEQADGTAWIAALELPVEKGIRVRDRAPTGSATVKSCKSMRGNAASSMDDSGFASDASPFESVLGLVTPI